MPQSSIARRRWLLLGAAAALGAVVAAAVAAPRLIGSDAGPTSGETNLERLAIYGQVPPFSLIERRGRPVRREDLLGEVWVANFIYTQCKETCPTQSLQIARLQGEFADAENLRFVSITVDPANDTPEVLGRYAERYGAHPDRWLFLTGDRREIYCLAKGFKLGVMDPADPSPPPCDAAAEHPFGALLAGLTPPPAWATHGSEGLIMHSARFVLVDRAAQIRAYHLGTDSESLVQLRANLRTLLAER